MYNVIQVYFTLTIISANMLFAQKAADDMKVNHKYALSSSFSLVSNYIFRGETQSDNYPAIQGGLEYGHRSRTFAGVWASSGSESVPLEIDLYAGYPIKLSDSWNLEIKGTGFIYPHASNNNSFEAAAFFTYGDGGFRYNYDFTLSKHYIEAGHSEVLISGLWFSIRAGYLIFSTPSNNDQNVADISFNLGYDITGSLELLTRFSWHEVERFLFSVGITANF